ncbi:MAG: DinB family protein [Flavobacteriales bacterium]
MTHVEPSLAAAIEAFAQAKRAILQQLEGMQDTQLKSQPLGGWSMTQVLEHIMHSEASTLAYMKKKTSSGWDSLDDATAEHQQTALALHERLQSDEKYQAPSVLPEPLNELGCEEIMQRWERIRIEWEEWLGDFDPKHMNKLVFRQPIAGMLTLVNAIQFLTLHIQHHIPQMVANRAAIA